MKNLNFDRGETVFSRDGKKRGVTTGGKHHCGLEGCSGRRIAVRWYDGTITFPCSKGLTPFKNGWKIE